MLEGKVKAALNLLDQSTRGGVLPLSNDTILELQKKHPQAADIDESVLLQGPIPFVDPVFFENLDDSIILKAAMQTRDSSGPSGLDAEGWRRILVSKSFGNIVQNLRNSLASFARKICSIDVHITTNSSTNIGSIEAYLACRLIPLDKCPGVRPIGVGEVLRRIIGKAVIQIVKSDIMESAGNLQLCAGQKAGSEAAVHAISDIFEESASDALLLVDATNAFNALSRKVLLHNIQYLCPPISTYVRNCYLIPFRLFVLGGFEISSCEGTTQGDPLAMPMYAIGIVPLLDLIAESCVNDDNIIKHAAFADDLGGAGKLHVVRSWWNRIVEFGPKLGYFPNATKPWLVIKLDVEQEAREIFDGTNIQITTEERKYLGGFIGSKEGKDSYVSSLVSSWCDQLKVLSRIAKSEPQSAYSAFVSGFRHRSRIKEQEKHLSPEAKNIKDAISAVIRKREENNIKLLNQLRERMTKEQLRANDLACMKGASSWLTTLPLSSENFVLNKREFYDAIHLRFRWPLKFLPSSCPCGKKFDVDHAMSCAKGGFVYQRHDETHDLFAHLMKEVYNDVKVEPHLQPITGESLPSSANVSLEARLDVSARGFWQRGQLAFFDVRVINPFAKSHMSQKLSTAFSSSEKEKKRQYNQRIIDVEHGSFSPLVFTPYGGCGREAENVIINLAAKLTAKKDFEHSRVVHWLRTKLSFLLLRSAILCVRGSRAIKSQVCTNLDDISITHAVGTIQ
eukprot:gene14696-biopygen11793